jgi:hypothetical protein
MRRPMASVNTESRPTALELERLSPRSGRSKVPAPWGRLERPGETAAGHTVLAALDSDAKAGKLAEGPELSRGRSVLTTAGDAEDREVDRLAGGHHGVFLLGLAPSGARPEWGGAWSGAAVLASPHPRGSAWCSALPGGALNRRSRPRDFFG